MAALALRLLQHSALLCATHSRLHNDAGARRDLLGLNGNLLCQLAGGRDDDGPDVVRLRPLVSADSLAELGIVLHDSLDDGDEETERLAGTRLCLRDTTQSQLVLVSFLGRCSHVVSQQCLVDGPGLHLCHGLEFHLLRDGVDEVLVHQSAPRQVGELCDWPIFLDALLNLGLRCDLLPLGAVVEARSRDLYGPGGW